MEGLELIRTLSKTFPGSEKDGRAPMAIAVAIRVACDRWTDADDEKYWPDFKSMIFQWAQDLEQLSRTYFAGPPPDPAKIGEEALGLMRCSICTRIWKEHSREQRVECLQAASLQAAR